MPEPGVLARLQVRAPSPAFQTRGLGDYFIYLAGRKNAGALVTSDDRLGRKKVVDTLQLICSQSEGNIQLRDYDGMGSSSDTMQSMIVKKSE